jgi:predicted metal-dependent peptidase
MAEPTSTSNKIPAASAVSKEEAASFELDPHLLNLMWDEPFFSSILRPITKVRTDAISTAGVLAKDGSITMWWNPCFLASLVPKKVKGLLKHECYHLVFEHTTTRKHDPHILWNYGTDLAINSVIPEDELPDCGLIPGKAFTPLTDEQKEKMGEEAVKRYTLISDKIESFPKEMSSEWYFARLAEDEDVSNAIQEGEASGDGFGIMDDHEGWGKMSEEERELIRGKVKQVLKEAAKKADSSNSWGSVPASMRAEIRRMVSNEVDWRAVLRTAIGTKKRAGRDTSIRRLNRKYPGIHPGSRRKYTSSWAVYVDQSGSVDDESLALLFGELENLAKRTTFDVFYFDTEVDVENKFTWKKGRSIAPKRTRCGGTDFNAPSKHAHKNMDKYDGYVILTDGYAPEPIPTRLRRVWVITPDGELQFPANRDVVVGMRRDAKKEAA